MQFRMWSKYHVFYTLKYTFEGEKILEANQYEENNSNRNQKLLNQLF
jgi:hypothetical protein